MTNTNRWTAADAGCIFSGSAHYTADELNARVILLAVEQGWDGHDGVRQDAQAILEIDDPHGVRWADDPDLAGSVSDGAIEAEGWLNEHVAPEGYSFCFDDGFYLWEVDEEGEPVL